MKINQHTFQRFGFTLQDVWAEIQEVTSRQNASFYDDSDAEASQKDGLVNIRIWSSEEARNSGAEPLETIQKVVSLPLEEKLQWHQKVINATFNHK